MLLIRNVKFFNKNTLSHLTRLQSTTTADDKIKLFNVEYERDDWTNINKNIIDKLNRNLLNQKYHPLNHLANKIKHFFNSTYTWHSSTPLFTILDSFKPVVTVDQNFDRLVKSFKPTLNFKQRIKSFVRVI